MPQERTHQLPPQSSTCPRFSLPPERLQPRVRIRQVPRTLPPSSRSSPRRQRSRKHRQAREEVHRVQRDRERVSRRIQREELEGSLEGQNEVRRPILCSATPRQYVTQELENWAKGTHFSLQLRCFTLRGLRIAIPSMARTRETGVPRARREAPAPRALRESAEE